MINTALSTEIIPQTDTTKLNPYDPVVPWVYRVSTSKTSGYITVRTIPTSPKINTNY